MVFLIYISSIEISPSLAKIQKETVAQVGSHLSKFRVECRDASDLAGWSKVLFVQHKADSGFQFPVAMLEFGIWLKILN
jgi:hypothetical protein